MFTLRLHPGGAIKQHLSALGALKPPHYRHSGRRRRQRRLTSLRLRPRLGGAAHSVGPSVRCCDVRSTRPKSNELAHAHTDATTIQSFGWCEREMTDRTGAWSTGDAGTGEREHERGREEQTRAAAHLRAGGACVTGMRVHLRERKFIAAAVGRV